MKNPKRFILAMIIITAAWQGGYWIGFMKTDLRFSNILTIILFLYIQLTSPETDIPDRYVKKILLPSIGLIKFDIIAAFQAEKGD